MMPQAEIEQLAADIKTNGLIHPIVRHDGFVLDGRNRLAACELAGIEPAFAEFEGGDPFAYVWSENATRRHLPKDQKGAIYILQQQESGAWHAEQKRKQAEANRARSQAADRQHQTSNPRAGESSGQVQHCTAPERQRETIAQDAGIGERTAGGLQSVANQSPELLKQIAAGETTLTKAARQIKRDGLSERVAALPDGQHRVIYADPPWSYGDERAGLDSSDSAAAAQYPTMKTADICALDIRSLTAPDSVLFLWATFPLLTDALAVVSAWGFKYKTAMVWDKQRANLGNYHDARAELLIIATRGSCVPEGEGRQMQIQSYPRGRHSAKPEEFRSAIDAMYPHGPRVELFRRGTAPAGWFVWGNEVE